MNAFQALCIFTLIQLAPGDNEYMVSKPETITLSSNYETELQCEMNIRPDKFQWKFYPSSDPYNPKTNVDLDGQYYLIPENQYKVHGLASDLPLEFKNGNTSISGDYQCLAYYGASVIASVPWRISITSLGEFPAQDSTEVSITSGNILSWRCLEPESNPEASIDYYKDTTQLIRKPYSDLKLKTLLLQNVSESDSGKYTCSASLYGSIKKKSSAYLYLKVSNYGPPRAPFFVMKPKDTYVVVKGSTAFLDCSAVGNPVPTTVWYKKNGELPKHRVEFLEGGLKIKNISATDDGVYVCEQKNRMGNITHFITLIYNEEPSVDCSSQFNSSNVTQGDNLELECVVRGTPEPKITWFLNGYSVKNDSAIEATANKIYFMPVEKRHAGNLQCFASNAVKTVYSSISIRVIPLSSSGADFAPTKKPKGSRKPIKQHFSAKMTPANKPTISRIDDESVNVRWTVNASNGLPIQFFKVQYKELRPVNESPHHSGKNGEKGAKWKTIIADIPSDIRDFQVNGLKPDHIYRFRIAAVYSNNDNKLSPNSDKFTLRRLDFNISNPLPIPLITRTETVNETAVRIYWECDSRPNVPIDGFYISYLSSTIVGDYLLKSVSGSNTKSSVITHLVPGTQYDIKMRSFNSQHTSDFSQIMKAATAAAKIPPTQTPKPPVPTKPGMTVYIFIASGVLIAGLIISAIVILFVCRKWKRNKSSGDRDKPTVEEPYIPADGNEYVVGPKSVPRSNGISQNRITITANPLADADNKNQNMIEMSCLSSQNNNCAATQPSASGGDNAAPCNNTTTKAKTKSREKRRKKQQSAEISKVPPGENYV